MNRLIKIYVVGVWALLGAGLMGCTAVSPRQTQAQLAPEACQVTEPAQMLPPDDSAVSNKPISGSYIVNDDQTIWVAAWWVGEEEYPLRAGENGNKVGWFRPAGADLKITGQRLDGEAAPMEASVPCCYPTQFQATGLYFPTEGCWKITAQAAESEIVFIVNVAPES